MKAVLRGKFIVLSSFIKIIKSQQINDLTLHLKALRGKNEQISRRQEIIKIRAEINGLKQLKKNDKAKSWFFENK